MSQVHRTEFSATIRCDAADGWYTATVETDGPSNGNVRLALTHRYSGEPSPTNEVPEKLLGDLGRLLVTWFGGAK